MSADIVAADQLKAIVQRVERLEAEIADLNADKSEIYKEARANGFDVKVIKKVVSKRKIDEHERVEQDHVFDLYWDAVHGINLVHAHARENIEQFDASPRLIKQVVDGMQTEAGRAALVAAVDIMIEREDADEFQAKASDDNGATEHDIEDTADSVRGDASRSSRGDDSPASHSEKATVATQGEATATTSDDGEATGTYAGEDRAAANAGGDDVESGAERATQTNTVISTGEGAANTALPAAGVVMEYVPPTGMKRLPFAHCFPDHSKAEYERLEKDIAANRVLEPIIRQGDVIVDGWARYNISRAYGMSYPIREIDAGRDALLDVIEWQRAARNFTPAQERKIAAELAKEFPHRADDIMAAFGLPEALEAAE